MKRRAVTGGRFVVFREELPVGRTLPTIALPEGFRAACLGEDRLDDLVAMAGRDMPADELRVRFMCRNLCLAILEQERIAAVSWASFGLFQFESYVFPLAADEAYLFDAYTAPAYRGRGLAGLARRLLHAELAARGRTCFYSVTLCNNAAAMRFKEKLHGRVVDTGCYVRLFDRWAFGTRSRPGRLRADRGCSP